MSLRDDVQAEIRLPGSRCVVPSAAAQLAGKDHAEFLEIMADLDTPASAISAALRKRGIVLGHQSINRHRRRICKCL